MSNSVFPSLPGLSWPVKKVPSFHTSAMRAVSGFERRLALRAYPLWQFTLTYEFLRKGLSRGTIYTELQTLQNFVLARQGMYDSFLYDDPTDDSVTDQAFGVGDGTTTQFQLTRSVLVSGFLEPVQNLNGSVTNIKDNGSVVAPANYAVSGTGLVTFTTAPATGHALTWTGAYYFRCRLDMDAVEFEQFMSNRWDAKSVKFVGSPANKV